jgi:hypothetical protein
VIETYRNRYKYFEKHYGLAVAKNSRIVALAHLWVRRFAYGIWAIFNKREGMRGQMKMYQAAIKWNLKLNMDKFIRLGEEPKLELEAIVSVQPAIGKV